MAWEEKLRTIERNGETKLKQELSTPASQNNGIKTDVVFVVVTVVVAVFVVVVVAVSLFECITHFSSVSLEDRKLIAPWFFKYGLYF